MVKQFYLIPTGSTTLGQSGPGSYDIEGVPQILQSSRTGASPSDADECHIQDTCLGQGVLFLCSNAIVLSYCPS